MRLEDKTLAIYGLGTETERFIRERGEGLNIVGLLDGFKDSGEAFGYPIISMRQAIAAGVDLILVVARPGSCKVIAKRIKEDCLANGIDVYDIRGNDLLEEKQVKFDFKGINVYTNKELRSAIDKVDVVSFDFFDTLVTRKVFFYTDIFKLIDQSLKNKEVVIQDFAEKRLQAEKELSVNAAPKLEQIYEHVLANKNLDISVDELSNLEWEIDTSLLILRKGMQEIISYAKTGGMKVILTTDCYYSKTKMSGLLQQLGLELDEIFVSCEYNKSKANGLFDIVKDKYQGKKILHIGDDQYVDVEKAAEYGVDSLKIFSPKDLFEEVGRLGISDEDQTFSDQIKTGLVVSKLFASPFQFESQDLSIQLDSAKKIGYAICGPMIMDFLLWFKESVEKNQMRNILFCARDGYLLQELYRKLVPENSKCKDVYFLTSRISAIRAGIKDESDIAYVDSMKFFGSKEESLLTRFGITLKEGEDRNAAILSKAKIQRANYQKYIEGLDLNPGLSAVFDFVAKGTSQLFMRNFMEQDLHGLYFLQLEPEFMADKGLTIESFYTEAERDRSVIFDNYYILETILTSPMPSVDEFDEQGNPKYAAETRSEANLACVKLMQEGILEFVDDYLKLVPTDDMIVNKQTDEAFLSLIGKLEVTDEKFKELVVEDPFFGRMTKITDVM